jgi:hypothetical protein
LSILTHFVSKHLVTLVFFGAVSNHIQHPNLSIANHIQQLSSASSRPSALRLQVLPPSVSFCGLEGASQMDVSKLKT